MISLRRAANWCTNFNCVGVRVWEWFMVIVDFRTSSAFTFRGWVRVGVLGYGFGVTNSCKFPKPKSSPVG